MATDLERLILLEGEALEVDESRYITCPACERPDKCSITRTELGVLYHCFRDACGIAGHAGATGAIPARFRDTEKAGKRFAPKYFTLATRGLTAIERAFMLRKFELTSAQLEAARWKYCPERNAYIFPVLNPSGFERGVTARYYHDRYYQGKKLPKAVAYKEVDGAWLCWYNGPEDSRDLWLVEDQVSALKMSQFAHTCALLGTHIDEREAMEISRFKADRVVIALDEDAIKSAYTMRKRYGLLWQYTEVCHLHEDLKDMRYEYLVELLG